MPRFSPGKSGNPKGRKPGTADRRTAARALFDAKRDELARKAIDLALGGDTVALRLCLERAIPTTKPQDAPVTLPELAGSIADQGRQVLAALAQGTLTPDQAATVMSTIATQARIIETEELERRIAALEAQSAGIANKGE